MKKISILLVGLLFMSLGFLQAQGGNVSGTVTSSEDGMPIPGVSVIVTGTTTGITTNIDGKYSLSVPSNATSLTFSFVGMKTQVVAIGGKSTLDVVLESDVVGLEEVVVTALGISRSEKALTYSIQKVDGDEMADNQDQNFVNALAGRVSGIQVTNSSGVPGASSRVVLRGATTINGSNEPLYVVDGIPIDNGNYGTAYSGGGYDMPNGAADINAHDIENVTVLSGPNAAALYGNRAANGVIVITTKSGKSSKGVGVEVSSSTTFENPLRLPNFQNSYGQGASNSYFEFVNGSTGDSDGVDESWGAPLDIGLEFVQWKDYETGTPSPWVSYPNNVKDFYETGITNNQNVALNGGNDAGNFRLSISNMNQKGVVPNTDYNKATFTGAGDYNLTSKLSASFRGSYIKGHSDNFVTVGYTNENPVQQMIWSGRNVNLPDLKDYENLPLADPSTNAAGTPLNWNTQFQNNPYWVQDNNLTKYDKARFIGNFKVNYNFTDYLSLFVRTGIDGWDSRVADQKAKGSNEYSDGFYEEIARKSYEWNTDFLMSFNRQFGALGVNVSGGGNSMRKQYTITQGTISGLELEGLYNLSNALSGTTPVPYNYLEEERINSLYFTTQFAFNDYVFFDITGRNDWWSVLPENNNNYFYPSVGLSAILSDIFNISSSTVNLLKVSAGWAQVGGKGALDPYDISQSYAYRELVSGSQFSSGPFGDVPMIFLPNTLDNPNIEPELTQGLEFVVHGVFFNGTVDLKAKYYDQRTENIIIRSEVSASSGYLFSWTNDGEMSNKGIELDLNLTLVRKRDFDINLGFKFATYNNEITSLGDLDAITRGGQWSVDLEAREGHPYMVLVGPAFEKDPKGNIIHENGLPVIADGVSILGDIQPDWTGGTNLDINYKGIRLGALVNAKFGGEMYSMTNSWGRYSGVLKESLKGREGGIVGNGVMLDNETGEYVPNNVVVSAEDYNKAAYTNDVGESSVFDASYVKLSSVNLSYSLPKSWFTNMPVQGISIGFIGRNLALLYSKIPHVDPESAFASDDIYQGLEFGQLPSVRSYGFNVNVKF